MSRFYADLNYNFGAWQEKRYAIFDRTTGRIVAKAIAPQYQSLKAAESCAKRLNELESRQ
jgi:hypothetical protein